jgi:hypothetical protein
MSLFLDWLAGSQWLNAHPTCHLLARFLVWFLCILQGLGVIFILDWFSSISRKNNNTEEFLQNFIVWLTILCLSFFFFFYYRGCPGQLARTSNNPTGPEVNDHVSLQWPSYERPQGSNLRPKRVLIDHHDYRQKNTILKNDRK